MRRSSSGETNDKVRQLRSENDHIVKMDRLTIASNPTDEISLPFAIKMGLGTV